MAVTIGGILETPGTALRLVAGRSGTDNAIRWVHVSELEDPTPWLKGGELLLTTGMGIGPSPAQQRAYLNRLAQAGLAGLGLGTGFSHPRVPKALEREADRLGFPLFEVPFEVPFIAITEAVFTRLGGEQVTALRRALETQAQLTEAALRDGAEGVVQAFARALGGWAVALDLHGLPVAAHPRNAGARGAALWDEIRLARPESPRFSLSLVDRGGRMSAHPITVGERVEGVLVWGTRGTPVHLEGVLASHAVSLLAIELDKTARVARAERGTKGDFLDALVGRTLTEEEATAGLGRFGFEAGEPVQVVALAGPASIEDRTWAVEDALSRQTRAFLTSPRDDILIALTPASVDAAQIRAEAAEKLAAPLVAGVGSPVPPEDAARGLREAMHAVRVCALDGTPTANFRSLGTYRLLLSLQDPDALRAFVEAVLQPLDQYDRRHGGELIPSLHAFLEHNARWEAASAQLAVHRHTLRYRMRKVEELTGRDLDSARDRIELWLALRGRELHGAR